MYASLYTCTSHSLTYMESWHHDFSPESGYKQICSPLLTNYILQSHVFWKIRGRDEAELQKSAIAQQTFTGKRTAAWNEPTWIASSQYWHNLHGFKVQRLHKDFWYRFGGRVETRLQEGIDRGRATSGMVISSVLTPYQWQLATWVPKKRLTSWHGTAFYTSSSLCWLPFLYSCAQTIRLKKPNHWVL